MSNEAKNVVRSQRAEDNVIVRAVQRLGRKLGFEVSRTDELQKLERERQRAEVMKKATEMKPEWLRDGRGIWGNSRPAGADGGTGKTPLGQVEGIPGANGRVGDMQIPGKGKPGEVPVEGTTTVIAINSKGERKDINVVTR